MVLVFISGVLGFFVFGSLRMYVVYQRLRIKELHFCGWPGVVVRVFAYTAFGMLGIFANLDILLNASSSGELAQIEVIGCCLRAFSIGLAGPAGVSKWNAKAGLSAADGRVGPPPSNAQMTLDTLELRRSHGWKLAYRRLLLR